MSALSRGDKKKKTFFFICELILTEANEALNFFSDDDPFSTVDSIAYTVIENL